MFKRKKKPKPEKPPRAAKRDDQFFAPKVSTEQQMLIGCVIVSWSKLEGMLQQVIWDFLRLSIEDGRVITDRLDVTAKLRILRTLAPRHLKDNPLENFLTVMDVIEHRQDDRNIIAHGIWSQLMPEDVPAATSLRLKGNLGEMMTETFPPDRMAEILMDLSSCLHALSEFLIWRAASRDKPAAPDHPG